ncbi:hypothetical protein Q8A64_17745 [Oxalobacteraceae bacterium R-40]|uniref:Uncharacterized protein n=1 Tax=Keguizhuia sedimenti TaxID=3064264 RepID=A0ABU1BTE7_9BURK|nr:hypothetical protein [Oxalobacteraceae bacterium R-40]
MPLLKECSGYKIVLGKVCSLHESESSEKLKRQERSYAAVVKLNNMSAFGDSIRINAETLNDFPLFNVSSAAFSWLN